MRWTIPAKATIPGRIRRGLWKLRSDPRQWFVLVGDRLVIAGLLTTVFTLIVLSLMVGEIIRVQNTSHVIYLAQGLIAGNVTLVTIVLSINQLVLSRELRTPGEMQHQIENVLDYRTTVEEMTGQAVIPTTPSDFLQVLLDGTRMNAQRLGGITVGSDRSQLREDVDDLVSTITNHTDHISEVLADSQEGIFSTLAVTLETNYSQAMNEARRIQTVYEDELTSEAQTILTELIESLEQIDIARQYFKTIYMQAELAKLSRVLLYVGVPAIGSALILFMVYVGGPSPVVPVTILPWFVLGVVTLGFAPLAVMFSYLLRIAMVAQRTVAITPFTTPEQEAELGDTKLSMRLENQ